MIDLIDAGAVLVRELVAEAAATSGNMNLSGWCGIASAVLVALYREAGLEAELASGDYVAIGPGPASHFWVMVKPRFATLPDQWLDYASLVDVTATQFPGFAETPIVRLDPGKPGRRRYELHTIDDDVLDDAFDERDHELVAALTLIAFAAARKRGLL